MALCGFDFYADGWASGISLDGKTAQEAYCCHKRMLSISPVIQIQADNLLASVENLFEQPGSRQMTLLDQKKIT